MTEPTSPKRNRLISEPIHRGRVNVLGEATYWHNHPDLPRLAQNMREQLEQQRNSRTVGQIFEVTRCTASAYR